MTSAGDNLIASTARALLHERIEATPWFRIRMTQEPRRAAIEQDVDADWHLFIADAAERLFGLGAVAHPQRSISSRGAAARLSVSLMARIGLIERGAEDHG